MNKVPGDGGVLLRKKSRSKNHPLHKSGHRGIRIGQVENGIVADIAAANGTASHGDAYYCRCVVYCNVRSVGSEIRDDIPRNYMLTTTGLDVDT